MISNLTFEQQSLLFANLSSLAYEDYRTFDDFGFSSVFLSNGGSQAYVLWDLNDIIVVCRGTQPNEFSDVIHDLEFGLTASRSGYGQVHRGFQNSIELVWVDMVKLLQKYGNNRKLWCTGHSLGAAMSTLIAARCARTPKMPDPTLFTYGSPRVGDHDFIKHMNNLEIEHHRWVNNADIVTRNPIFPYKHHGKLHYFDHYGDVRYFNRWQMIKDRVKGFYKGLKVGKINFFVNHFMDNYIKNLERLQSLPSSTIN